MPWPLYILIAVIIVFSSITLLPDLVLYPKGYFKKLKLKKATVDKVKKKRQYILHMQVVQVCLLWLLTSVDIVYMGHWVRFLSSLKKTVFT